MGHAWRGALVTAGVVVVARSGFADADGDDLDGPATAFETARRLDDVLPPGILTFPVLPGAGLTVLNNFGGFSVSGGPCAHRGIDIFPTGDPTPRQLVACVDGVIEGQRRAPGSGAQGNAWILRDADGVSYRYHHIAEFEPGLEVGSPVERGQVIATMGASGNTGAAHLHFEVRPDGTGASAVDPIPLLAIPNEGVEVGPPTGCR